jgi:hypothetical protein
MLKTARRLNFGNFTSNGNNYLVILKNSKRIDYQNCKNSLNKPEKNCKNVK